MKEISTKIEKIGFYTGLYGIVIVLIWIGLFKFTPTEAKAIAPLVENSPLMSWMYSVGNLQSVSIFIGIFEIISALLLASFPFSKKLALIGGVLTSFIFFTTLTFLFTTPDSFTFVDGFLVPDAFILKDISALGIGLLVVGLCLKKCC